MGAECRWRCNRLWHQSWWWYGNHWQLLTWLILTFVHIVFIRTDVHEFWSPSTQFLITMREKGYALFLPGSTDKPMPHPPVTLRVPLLPAASSTLTEPTPRASSSCSDCSRIFSMDYCEAITGGSYSTEGIPMNGKDRILPPSGTWPYFQVYHHDCCVVTAECLNFSHYLNDQTPSESKVGRCVRGDASRGLLNCQC